MIKTITAYLLEWNIDSKKGKIILRFKDQESEEMMEDLDFQTFTAVASVLEKGKTKLDTKENSIYNVMS